MPMGATVLAMRITVYDTSSAHASLRMFQASRTSADADVRKSKSAGLQGKPGIGEHLFIRRAEAAGTL
jgi:hypothetical protein